MGAVRSLRFSPDGRFLAMAEPADFVHIFDVNSGFREVRRATVARGTNHALGVLPHIVLCRSRKLTCLARFRA